MMKVGKLGVWVTAVLAALFLYSDIAKAETPGLVINEIFPAPSSGGKEWIELYNPTSNIIDLAGFALKDGSVAAKSLSGQVAAGGYFVLEVASGWLNNSGEIIFLLDSSGEIVDKVAYGDWETQVLPSNTDTSADDNAKAPQTGQSISRIPDGSDSDRDDIDFRIIPSTPNAMNELPSYPGGILINEVSPRPINGSEFEYIELFNENHIARDISNWQLDDCEGGSSPYRLPVGTTIEARSYLAFSHSVTKISLNDSGDQVRLFDPNGILVDMIAYDGAKINTAYAKFTDKWIWTTTPTENGDNIFTEETPSLAETGIAPNETSISETKMRPVGSEVATSGIVSVLPGVLSAQYFYIQDDLSGVQIYSSKSSFPELKLGDRIKVLGELSTYYGEARIKIFTAFSFQDLGNT